MRNSPRSSLWVSRIRRLGMAITAATVLFSAGCAGASETVSNRFDLFVPVNLSVLEISSAIGLVPAPVVVAFAVVRPEAIATVIQKVRVR